MSLAEGHYANTYCCLCWYPDLQLKKEMIQKVHIWYTGCTKKYN